MASKLPAKKSARKRAQKIQVDIDLGKERLAQVKPDQLKRLLAYLKSDIITWMEFDVGEEPAVISFSEGPRPPAPPPSPAAGRKNR